MADDHTHARQPKRDGTLRAGSPLALGFTAHLAVVRTEENGRSAPVFDGYRAQSRFTDDQPWDNDVTVRLHGGGSCPPGAECVADLSFHFPDAVAVPIIAGAPFVLREGPHIVVRGRVLRVTYDPGGS